MLSQSESDNHKESHKDDPKNNHGHIHHYNLIASAIAGRSITVHWHNSQKFSTYTDSRSIFLPISSINDDLIMEVIAQALLLRNQSLKRKIIQRCIGKKQLGERYIYAEICRAAKLHSQILPRRFTDSESIASFPHHTVSSDDSYRLANSNIEFPEYPEFLGNLRSVLVLKTTIPEAAFTALTKKQQQGQFEYEQAPELSEEEQETAEESKILKLFQNPLFSGGTLGKLLNEILGAGRSGKPEDNPNSEGGAEMPVGSVSQAKKKGVFATLTELAFDLVTTPESNDTGSQSYPEWDYTKKDYRKNWALVDEMDPWREEPESESILNEVLLPPTPLLKRKLAGIGLSFETHRNQQDGEDYTLDRVIDYVIDYRMGTTPDERLFDRGMKTKRDLAAMVLLDISGSTAEKDLQGQSIHHQQMRLAYQVTRTLHELGDQVSLYAFHSWGRTLVRLLRLKSFKERVIDSRIYKRFSYLEPVGYTRTGAALRHAAKKLKEETGLPYCILIVITDGFSYDQDYEGKYGEEDTKKALEEIRSEGIGCLCLTIGSSQDELKLKEVYGAASTLSVRNHEEFINNIRPAVLKAIRYIKAA